MKKRLMGQLRETIRSMFQFSRDKFGNSWAVLVILAVIAFGVYRLIVEFHTVLLIGGSIFAIAVLIELFGRGTDEQNDLITDFILFSALLQDDDDI